METGGARETPYHSRPSSPPGPSPSHAVSAFAERWSGPQASCPERWCALTTGTAISTVPAMRRTPPATRSPPATQPRAGTVAPASAVTDTPGAGVGVQGGPLRLVAPHVQTERRVMARHQCRVAGYTNYPAVEAEHEVENLLGLRPVNANAIAATRTSRWPRNRPRSRRQKPPTKRAKPRSAVSPATT